MLCLLRMGPSKVLTTFSLQFRALGSSHSWSCFPCRNTVTLSSDSSDMYTSTVQSAPPVLMLHSRVTLVSKPPILLLPILYLLSSSPSPPSLAPGRPSTPPASYLFSIAPLAVAPLLTSPLLLLLLLFLAPGRCFRTWVLTIYQFFCPSLSLRSIAPTSVPLPSTFSKLAGMALPPTLTLTVLQQRNTRLFPLLLLSLFLWH